MVLRDAPGPDEGHGSGTFTDDGCPVEMFAAMPSDVEAARIVHSAIPLGSSVLEMAAAPAELPSPWPASGTR